MNYKIEESIIKGFTGVDVYYRKYTASNANKTLIVVHGLGEHSGRYLNLVDYFNEKNTNIYLIDNRGHGKSGGKIGHINLWGQYLDDLRIFVEKVREEKGESEHDVFLLGHSMGGNIVANYLIQRDSYFTGAILSAPGFKVAGKANPIKTFLGRVLSGIAPSLTMSNGLNPNDLSHDLNAVYQYMNDPLVHDRISARWFTQFLWAGKFALHNAKFIKCPVLILQGRDDSIISPDGAKEFYENLNIKTKELHIINNFYHEIFNEVKKEIPFKIIEDWLNKCCKIPKRTISYVS